ncbi:hypothetical protein KFK09_027804 [Dendrobium nobile]|uniref:Zinc finger MYM-type protein 1-like n=1 Tax=Dendrobium nobile TaxID=94219 RepID=A0A8T3A1J4_DENNO|nr:hypothetical protein KFK09_027804 [Dendrobium nobile]
MTIIVRFVNKKGNIVEQFLGISRVSNTAANSLKLATEQLLSTYGLSISRIRGQGYDGASNMRREFNGLKALFLNENPSAHYIHCFSHQLQLALVAVAKSHVHIALLFTNISSVMNLVGVSCKRRDQVREIQRLNQEKTLRRAGDTRWGSHYESILRLITMFSTVIDVLEIILEDGLTLEQKDILGITNELSQALQRGEQDIINAMSLVRICKKRLQDMRDNKWTDFINNVTSFCQQQKIKVPHMDDKWVARGRSRRRAQDITNLYHFWVEIFYTVLDMQLQELNNRFTELNTELLLCIACLNPNDGFHAFNKDKLIQMTQFYPTDFSLVDRAVLENQLDTYIMDMRSDDQFTSLKDVGSLAEKMIQSRKDIIYPVVFKLLELALVLPVATAGVERAFSAMNIIKNRLRNRIGDQWMNDLLLAYVEKEILDSIDNEVIIQLFQNMKSRRYKL